MSLVTMLLNPGRYALMVSDGRAVDCQLRPVSENTRKVFQLSGNVIVGIAGLGVSEICTFLAKLENGVAQLSDKLMVEDIFKMVERVNAEITLNLAENHRYFFLVCVKQKNGQLGLIQGSNTSKGKTAVMQIPKRPTLAVITPLYDDTVQNAHYNIIASNLRSINISDWVVVRRRLEKIYSAIARTDPVINGVLYHEIIKAGR